MYIDLILMSKDKENVVQVDDIISLIENKFDYSNNIINLEDNEIECVVKSSNYNKSVSVYLSIDGYRESEARILNNCLNILKRGNHRKSYHLTVAYDESSKYMAEKLYPYISKYERLLRYVIYLTFINTLGNKWVSETLEHNKNIDFNANKVEDILEQFNLEHYEYFLFDEVHYYNAEEVLEEITEAINNDDFNKSRWKLILNKKRPYSLWDKYFSSKELDYVRDNHQYLRKFRNKVMHNKNIEYDDFKRYRSIIRRTNKQLLNTIEDIKSEKINTISVLDLVGSFKNLIEKTYQLTESFVNFVNSSSMKEFYSKIENLSKSTTIALEKIESPISNLVKNISKNNQNIKMAGEGLLSHINYTNPYKKYELIYLSKIINIEKLRRENSSAYINGIIKRL